MNFLNKLERKIGKYAIPNLTRYMIGGFAIGYILDALGLDTILNMLALNPYYILQGQVWRLFTWVITPPSGFSILIIITLFFYYSVGTSLEQAWGAFRYNLYMFMGFLFTVLGAFILYFAVGGASYFTAAYSEVVFSLFSTYYVTMSIFLAFAATYPNSVVNLYFVIPIKIKWLGIVYAVMLLYSFLSGDLVIKVVIGASLLNFVIYFLWTRNYRRMSPNEIRRKKNYTKQVREARTSTRHKCAICGRTEETNPELDFRYCSKCDGNYEYCQDHLFTHTHIHK